MEKLISKSFDYYEVDIAEDLEEVLEVDVENAV